MTEDLRAKTAKTAGLYFENYVGERPFDLWRSFDKGLAKELSMFITGQMYLSRTNTPHYQATYYHICVDCARKGGRTQLTHKCRPECRLQAPRNIRGHFSVRNLRRNAGR